MYCAVLASGIRLLAKCLSRPSPIPAPEPSPDGPFDELMSGPGVNVGVQVYKHDFDSESFGNCSSARAGAAPPVLVASHVSCRLGGRVLQTRAKVQVPIQVVNPALVQAAKDQAELDALAERVREMDEELARFRAEAADWTSRVPVGCEDEEKIEGEPVQVEWMGPVEVAEFTMRVVRCGGSVEDVDEVLGGLYVRMSRLVEERTEDIEQRGKWAVEVNLKIKEYAEVLLDSPCEVRLAVERARVHAAGSCSPGDETSTELMNRGVCYPVEGGVFCAESYFPHDAMDPQDYEPEMCLDESLGSEAPSSMPSTPRSSNVGLSEEAVVVGEQEETHNTSAKEIFELVFPFESENTRVDIEKKEKKSFNSECGSRVVDGLVWR